MTAAWTAAGSPRERSSGIHGPCARCLRTDELSLTSKVVSENFTAYGDWLNPQGRGLCSACAWAYTTPALRAKPHLVTHDPAGLTPLTPRQLFQALAHPLSLDTALVIPSRAGRKHVLPLARWGRAQLDDTTIAWTVADVARLHTMADLREQGASRTALSQAAPSWRVLRAVPADQQPRFMAQWAELQPWRQARPWLQLGILATG